MLNQQPSLPAVNLTHPSADALYASWDFILPHPVGSTIGAGQVAAYDLIQGLAWEGHGNGVTTQANEFGTYARTAADGRLLQSDAIDWRQAGGSSGIFTLELVTHWTAPVDSFYMFQTGSAGDLWDLTVGGGNPSFRIFTTSGDAQAQSFTGIAAGFNHIVATCDGSSLNLFQNGVLTATASVSAGPSVSTPTGWYLGEYGATLNFGIQAVRVYSRALSTSEVQHLYRDPFAITTSPITHFTYVPALADVTPTGTGSLTSSATIPIVQEHLPTVTAALTSSATLPVSQVAPEARSSRFEAPRSILRAIQGIDGTGVYTVDLSGGLDDAIRYGLEDKIERKSFIDNAYAVCVLDLGVNYDQKEIPSGYHPRQEIVIRLAAMASTDEEARIRLDRLYQNIWHAILQMGSVRYEATNTFAIAYRTRILRDVIRHQKPGEGYISMDLQLEVTWRQNSTLEHT